MYLFKKFVVVFMALSLFFSDAPVYAARQQVVFSKAELRALLPKIANHFGNHRASLISQSEMRMSLDKMWAEMFEDPLLRPLMDKDFKISTGPGDDVWPKQDDAFRIIIKYMVPHLFHQVASSETVGNFPMAPNQIVRQAVTKIVKIHAAFNDSADFYRMQHRMPQVSKVGRNDGDILHARYHGLAGGVRLGVAPWTGLTFAAQVFVLVQAVEFLQGLHGIGWTHNLIVAENIWANAEGKVLVINFFEAEEGGDPSKDIKDFGMMLRELGPYFAYENHAGLAELSSALIEREVDLATTIARLKGIQSDAAKSEIRIAELSKPLQQPYQVVFDLSEATPEQITYDLEIPAQLHRRLGFVLYNAGQVKRSEIRAQLEAFQKEWGVNRVRILDGEPEANQLALGRQTLIHVEKSRSETRAVPEFLIPHKRRLWRAAYLEKEIGLVSATLWLAESGKRVARGIVNVQNIGYGIVAKVQEHFRDLVFARAA